MRLAVIPGDGIGPEVTAAVERILEAAGADVAWDRRTAGLAAVETHGDPLPPETVIPAGWRDDVRRRGLRAEPPETMTEGGHVGFTRWDPFTESRVDRAITRTRTASFPYFGLDPDDPRD